MKQSLQYASAIVGIIVGAGFASGQEVLQFFTYFGWKGTLGAIVATILFAFLFMRTVQLGTLLQATSHKQVLNYICGKYLGTVIDLIITFFLFGVLVVMFAGSGSLFEQQFGLPNYVGSLFMALVTIATVFLNVEKIISVIGSFTLFLFLMIIIIVVYSLATADFNFTEMKEFSKPESVAAPNWLLGAALYVSYCLAAGFSMLTVMGGISKDDRETSIGGVLGGVLLGLLIILFHISMFSKIDQIQNADLPALVLASNIAPWFAGIMFILILGQIYNTAVGCLYSFTVRFFKPENPRFKYYNIGIATIAFMASFVGFTELVGTLYPITGYLGFVLIAAIIWSRFKTRTTKESENLDKEKSLTV